MTPEQEASLRQHDMPVDEIVHLRQAHTRYKLERVGYLLRSLNYSAHAIDEALCALMIAENDQPTYHRN